MTQLTLWAYLFRYRGVEVADHLCCGVVARADLDMHLVTCALATRR